MYHNEYKTKKNKNWTKDKIESQHVHLHPAYLTRERKSEPILGHFTKEMLKRKNKIIQ